jgi:hypothetical protein
VNGAYGLAKKNACWAKNEERRSLSQTTSLGDGLYLIGRAGADGIQTALPCFVMPFHPRSASFDASRHSDEVLVCSYDTAFV